ncbi:putative helicase [Halotydeus destructor]|nr:putative helicase [Halotydeus destructor]
MDVLYTRVDDSICFISSEAVLLIDAPMQSVLISHTEHALSPLKPPTVTYLAWLVLHEGGDITKLKTYNDRRALCRLCGSQWNKNGAVADAVSNISRLKGLNIDYGDEKWEPEKKVYLNGMEPEPGMFYIKRACFTSFMEKFCHEIATGEVSSSLPVRETIQKLFAASLFKPTLTAPLQKNIFGSLILDVDIIESSWKPSPAEMLELELEIISAVRRTVLHWIFKNNPSTAVLFVIVCDRAGSHGRHFHFPEVVMEADTYNVLVSQIRDIASLLNESVKIDYPTHFSMPLTTSEKKISPYLPRSIYTVWRKDEQVKRISLADSGKSKLTVFLSESKNRNSQNSVLLLQKLQERKKVRQFETLLLMLLSPIPCVENWKSFWFVLPTKITKTLSKGKAVMNLTQKGTENQCLFMTKDLEQPKVALFHQDGLIKWKSLMNKSECFNVYYTIVPAVVVDQCAVADEVNNPYPGLFWMKSRAEMDSLLPTSSIHGEPLKLCEHHNRLVSEIANLCGEARNSPHPILNLMANEIIVAPVLYAFFKECGGDFISFKEVCEFFKVALSRFLDVHEDQSLMRKITRISHFDAQVANKTSSNFSFAGLKRFIFQKTFFDQVQQLDIIEGRSEAVDQQTLPVYVSASFYHQYLTDVQISDVQNNMTEAVSNMYDNLMTFAKCQERGGNWSYWIFDPFSKIWQAESPVVFLRFFKSFKSYVIQTMMKLETDQKVIEAVKKSKPTSDVLSLLQRTHCKAMHKMDSIEYFLLVQDSKKKYKVYDMLEGDFVTPIADHECTGNHVLHLSCEFSVLSRHLESKQFLPLIRKLYFSNFLHHLKKKLLAHNDTNDMDQTMNYSSWKEIYKGVILRELEKDDSELLKHVDRQLLDQLVSAFIYLGQTFRFQDRLTAYVVTRLASIFVKNSAEREILLWTGNGSNGKTHLMTLLLSCLGSYAGTVSSSVFTNEKEFDDTLCKNVFTGCLLAADELKDFDATVLKTLAGNGEITARGIFKSQIVGRISTRFLAALNTIPNRPLDRAAQSRLICIPFSARFHSDSSCVPQTIAEQVDKSIFCAASSASAAGFEMPLLITLLGVLKLKLKTESGTLELPPMPRSVEQETKKLRERCDCYNKFIVTYGLVEVPMESISLAKVRQAIIQFTKPFPTHLLDDIILTFVRRNGHLITFEGALEQLQPKHAMYLLETNYELLAAPVKSRRHIQDTELPTNEKEEIEHIMQDDSIPQMSIVHNIESLIIFRNLTLKRVRDAEAANESKRTATMFPVFDIKRNRKF